MTMKRRIFLSNTLIVLVSLLLLFGVFGVFGVFHNEYMEAVEEEFILSDYTYELQTLLMEEQQDHGTWDELAQKLDAYGFALYVTDENQEQQFSNISQDGMEHIELLRHFEPSEQTVKLYCMDGVTAAKTVFLRNGASFSVYAVQHIPESLWATNQRLRRMFPFAFVLIGFFSIAGLLLCSQCFTKLLIKKIMKPVEVLEQAAKRINDGDLDTPIVYEEADEFQPVCHTFNNMQRHLKEGMEKNAAYEKARTEMISGISHDLRTPLTSIKAFVKGILDGVANTPEKQEQYLRISYQKACDMDVLLEKLFFLSKLETGNMPLFLEQIEFGRWMEQYVAEKKLEGQTKGYTIALEQEHQNYFVNMDVEQMKRVFDNLLENSVKYANSDPLQIRIRIKQQDQTIAITIQDNGEGMAPDKIPHVFEQFYRGDESRNSKNDGSGLGLYVCKYIVEEHGGTIDARQQDGFVVAISLPVMK